MRASDHFNIILGAKPHASFTSSSSATIFSQHCGSAQVLSKTVATLITTLQDDETYTDFISQVMAAPSWGSALIPEIVFCFYELMFCACAVMIVVGGAFERGRIIPSILFGFCWATVCYCPIAYWTWNANGWLYTFGALDFAGGGPVHMSSGAAGLAYALVLGKRKTKGDAHVDKPHNVTITFLGTVLIWVSAAKTRLSLRACSVRSNMYEQFGWFGFNGGSAINASMRSMAAIFNTQVAASTGCIGYSLVGYFKHKRRFSVIVACEGIIAGLVGITPAAGYVTVWYAAAIGFLTALACSCLDGMHNWLNIDDGLEVFKLHGIGGACGAFLTGIFATQSISALDGIPTLASGAVDGNGVQIAKQLAEIASIMSYSFVCSVIMLFALKYTPFLGLRVSDEVEELGVDLDQFHDELIGEWSNFTIEENSVTRGMTAVQMRNSVDGTAPGGGVMTPPVKEEVTVKEGSEKESV